MTPQLDTLETIGSDLEQARQKLQAARHALQAAPGDDPVIRQAADRLERMEAELDRIESGIAVREGLAS
jgi:hypothetical protein